MSIFKRLSLMTPVLGLISNFALADDSALVAAGKEQGQICTACHLTDKGAGASIGPPLWGLAEREIGSHTSFTYSDGLTKLSGKWTPEQLDQFLTSPSSMVPDTKMLFPGIKDDGARKAIIAWLATLNDNVPTSWAQQDIDVSDIKVPGAGVLKEGEGMSLVATTCNACHSLHLVAQQGLSKDSWDETLDWMIDEQGMDELDDKERDVILNYLSTHYGI
ncbi:c-type cytochrome [Vibrio sp.]|nr:c-type cytochrome [Vibrio sp.]